MTAQQEGTEQEKRACVLCGNQFPGNIDVCPNDGTLLTPLSAEPKPGDIFADRYEILSVLGDGGMGKVYKARHNLMKRIVAIKMLLPHFVQNAAALKRFQQEAQAASALNHPHILYVHDFGISKQGMPFLVMDYLEGESLAGLLAEEGRLDEKRAVPIFIQACSALAHAHQKGVIHRDIKPANIMLINYEGQSDYLKIVDFGIAKLLQPDGAEQLTHTGEVFGSPLYMSPEQCRGKELDVRSDIYSLGCVLYRTVTGKPVFGGRDAMECMYRQVNDQPLPFSEVCPELDLSKKLEDAVMKAISKEPDDRYPSMSEFKDALEDVAGVRPHPGKLFSVPPQSGQEVAYDAATDRLKRPVLNATQLAPSAKSPQHSENQHAPSASNTEAESVAAEAIAPDAQVVAPGADAAPHPLSQAEAALASVGTNSAAEPASAAANPTEDASQAADVKADPAGSGSKAAMAPPVVHANLAAAAGATEHSISISVSAASSASPSAPAEPMKTPGDQSAVPVGSSELIRSSRSESPSQNREASPQEQSKGGTDKKIVMAGVALLLILIVAGIGAIVMNSQENPVKTTTNTAGPKSNQKADTLVQKSQEEIKSGNYKNAEETLEQASSTAKSDDELYKILPSQADVYQTSGKYAQAEQSWKKYLELQEKKGASKEDVARTKAQLSLPILELGRVDEASQLLEDAKKVLSDAPEAEKKGLSHVLYGLSKIAVQKGDLANAEQYLQLAIERRIKINGGEDADLIQYYLDQGAVYLLQNKLDLSQKSLNKSLQIANSKPDGASSPPAADAYKDLATIAFKQGQLGKAEKLFTQSLEIKKKDFGADSLPAAELMAALAMLYTREGKYKLADPLFKQALDIRTQELGADSAEAKRTRDNYAVLQARMKKGR